MNWRNMLSLGSSKPLVMKLLRNFFNLREFLFAGFLRFMKLSNIMDLSYFCSSTRSNARKKLLSNKITTCDVCLARTVQLPNGIWFRQSHSFTNYRFGAGEARYPGRYWRKDESVSKEWVYVEVVFYHKWRHFCVGCAWVVFGCSVFWDQFCRVYLGSGCFFFHRGVTELEV